MFSEKHENNEDSSVDREITKTFNPEAQIFQPIDAISSNLNALSLTPNESPQGSSPTSAPSPTNKTKLATSPQPAAQSGPFLPRSTAPLTFTTATFAQTKFGSTKLKTSSKRANRYIICSKNTIIFILNSKCLYFRMSPIVFSNYIKHRAMQQQLHYSNGSGHLGTVCPSSPSRSLSPNPLAIQNDPYFIQNGLGMHQSFGSSLRNMFDSSQFHTENNVYPNSTNKYVPFMEPPNFYSIGPQQSGLINTTTSSTNSTMPSATVNSPGTNQENKKILDSLNSIYSNRGPYQHLLVAN